MVYYVHYKLGTHLPTNKAYYYNLLSPPPLPGIAVATAIGRTTNGCHVHIPRYNIIGGGQLVYVKHSVFFSNTLQYCCKIVIPRRRSISSKMARRTVENFNGFVAATVRSIAFKLFVTSISNGISVFSLVLRRRSRSHNQQRQIERGPR